MDLYMAILRILHIGAGVFWAGATFFLVSFLIPTVQAAGPDGGRFMQRLAQGSYPRAISGAAILNIVTGLLLYWRDSAGLQSAWIGSALGLTLTIGGVAGTIAFLRGVFITKPVSDRLGELGKVVAASGGPPSPEQMAEMQRLQAKLTSGARVVAYLLGFTVLAMAAARYL
ncbi:MAG TPA: hypothetical protein VGR24_01515 [bacterium]|nr:hypothetical protein [bacterium]